MSEPLQEARRRMRVMYERIAGIDVHKDMIKVGIRTPGHRDTGTPGMDPHLGGAGVPDVLRGAADDGP